MALVVIVLAGYAQPDHSHRLDFVSELNAAGSQYPELVGYLGFFPIGLLTLLFLWRLKDSLVMSRRVAVGLAFVALVGTDWLVTVLAPCDAGCPASGDVSVSQQVHALSGVLTMLLMPIGIYLLIKPLKAAGFSKAVVVASIAAIGAGAATFLLLVTAATESVGLVQRINVSIFYAYLGLLSIEIYKRLPDSGGRRASSAEAGI